jgi:hypothetical protein
VTLDDTAVETLAAQHAVAILSISISISPSPPR